MNSNNYVVIISKPQDKFNTLKSIGMKYFIDDNEQTCCSLKIGDIIPILYEQPWNVKSNLNFERVKNWHEIN